jgi:hypothetical protein
LKLKILVKISFPYNEYLMKHKEISFASSLNDFIFKQGIWSNVFNITERTKTCGNKMLTRSNNCFLLQILLLAQHVSGTTMPIIRSSRALYRLLLPVVFGALVFKLSVWCGAEGYVSGLRAAAA